MRGPMNCFRRKFFHLLCAFFALFVVTGDLIADAVHDASGACVTESQDGDHASCPACGCSLHTGAALALDRPAFFLPVNRVTFLADDTAQKAIGSPAEIDHPPQLG